MNLLQRKRVCADAPRKVPIHRRFELPVESHISLFFLYQDGRSIRCFDESFLSANISEIVAVKYTAKSAFAYEIYLLEFTVNVPKQRRTFCKKCKVHKTHKVTQYKKSKERHASQGRRRYDRKQQGFGGQTKPIFRKKAKTTKKIVLRMECTECKYRKQIPLKRCKHFELGGDKKRKGQMIQF
ncbi:60S ribosomal protein L44 isoform X1 [Formica exsecta]|uniref:60S ribosomal protein L44 isoform X1 n=1 Tax=Formica exsecta TaxID=72781 RepID=UPI001142DD0D|nr:60S ribosomal protein L44 isoform X1 [Formica exsecta]